MISMPELTFTPQSSTGFTSVTQLPAASGSVARFEELMYAPVTPGANYAQNGLTLADLSGANGLRVYVEKLAQRWEAGQSTLQKMTDAGQFTSKELVLAQIQMINCALDVEVSSKCAAMFENGVQTLIQRSG